MPRPFRIWPVFPFLEMVFKESLRLYPPAYGVVREAVNDCEIGGYPIPKGATLAMFQCSVHRDPRFFDRPDDFVPERWENDFGQNPSRCAYFPFGAGPRLCIGNTFAPSRSCPCCLPLSRRSFSLSWYRATAWPPPSP